MFWCLTSIYSQASPVYGSEKCPTSIYGYCLSIWKSDKKNKIRSSNVNTFCLEHFYTIKYNTFFHTFLCSTTYQKLVFYAGIPLTFTLPDSESRTTRNVSKLTLSNRGGSEKIVMGGGRFPFILKFFQIPFHILQTSATSNDEPLYVVEVLLNCSKTVKKLAGGEAPIPCKPGEKGEMQVTWSDGDPMNERCAIFLIFCLFFYPLLLFKCHTCKYFWWNISPFIGPGHLARHLGSPCTRERSNINWYTSFKFKNSKFHKNGWWHLKS